MSRGTLLTAAILVVLSTAACSPPPDDESAPKWQEAFDATEEGWLLSVSGRSPDGIYAVGGRQGDGTILRYDGASWGRVELSEKVPILTWVHCFPDGRPIVAGNDGTIIWRREDGWEIQETPTDQNHWGVWGETRDEVWAVGGNGDPASGEATVMRYDGSSWTSVQVPDLRHDGVNALFKVWGTSPDNVYMVGQNGTILHWDGSRLVDESPDTDKDLISLWGSGPDNVAVVGGRGNGVLVHWDGSNWTPKSLKPLIGLNGIWVRDSETAWVDGAKGTIAKVDPTAAEPEPAVTRIDTPLAFHAIFGLKGTGLYAVGGNLSMPGATHRGVAYHRKSTE